MRKSRTKCSLWCSHVCLVSSLWFSCGLAVSMGEAAKPLLFEGFQAGCHAVLRGKRGTYILTCLQTCRKSFYVDGTKLLRRFQKMNCIFRGRRSTLETSILILLGRAQHFKCVALRALHSTLHTLHFTLYTPHSTLYTPHSTLYNLHSTLYTPHSIHSTLHSLHSTLHTLHSTLFRIPQSTVHWYGNRGKMYRTVQITWFTKVFYVTAFGFVGCILFSPFSMLLAPLFPMYFKTGRILSNSAQKYSVVAVGLIKKQSWNPKTKQLF